MENIVGTPSSKLTGLNIRAGLKDKLIGDGSAEKRGSYGVTWGRS
jgi:hypothetical protein